MGKNLIPIIAKELGVEIGEEFKIKEFGDKTFCFTKTNLEWQIETGKGYLGVNSSILVDLVRGYTNIIKLPFAPQMNDEYWTYDYDWDTVTYYWHNDFMDCVRFAKNCVFRTQEEAERARPALYKELTSKDWVDWEDDVD